MELELQSAFLTFVL